MIIGLSLLKTQNYIHHVHVYHTGQSIGLNVHLPGLKKGMEIILRPYLPLETVVLIVITIFNLRIFHLY